MNQIFKTFAFILFAIFLFIGKTAAQSFHPYEWEENRKLTELTEEELAYNLYYLQFSIDYQFVFDEKLQDMVVYITNHQIIRTNNDEALNRSNKVYIPMYNTMEVVEVQARAIRPNNEIINFDKENLKELESEDKGYKIFAIEGAEIGGEIEYFFTRKVEASNFLTNVFQYNFPIKSVQYSLQCPENLEFEFRVYNWKDEVQQTDTTDQYNHYVLQTSNVPALFEEEFSTYESRRARIECKLAYNSDKGNARLFTWGEVGKRIYNIIYDLNKEEEKSLNKIIKEIGFRGNAMDDFLRAEHFIKSNYFFEKRAGDAGEDISMIYKNKYATERGFTKLFAALLKNLNIRHEIVLTSNRFEKFFDPEFDSWTFLDSYLIYLPDADKFLSPNASNFRLGTVPYGYIGNYGLFIREEPVQDFLFPVAYTGYVNELPYQDNQDNLDIDVTFSDDLIKTNVHVKREFTGYSAFYLKSGLLELEEDKKKEMLDDIIKYLAVDAEIKNIKVVKANTDYTEWSQPFIVEGEFSSQKYIEMAGDVVLFKAGDLIGPQSELYQENTRTLPVANTFNRGYKRLLKIHIPNGYKIENPEELVIVENVINDDKTIYKFESSYQINGQILEITIDEYYDQLYYPKEKFEAFRKVINSAADFNKIVLVMSKK